MLGYDVHKTWYPPGIERGTKEAVEVAAAIAAALAVRRLGGQLINKAEAVNVYAGSDDGPFSDFVGHLWRRCVVDWGSAIPSEQEDLRELAELLGSLLALENHFLEETSALP